MNSSSTSRIAVRLNESNQEQLSYLCLLLVAVNKACMKREDTIYISGSGIKSKTLTEFQKLLTMLAMICDTLKGDHGRTVTALVCLKGINGPEFILTSNCRKQAELEETKLFLCNLLTFVGTNPDKLQQKPLQKQVLWRSIVFNFDKVNIYLSSLIDALDTCIDCECQRGSVGQYKPKPACPLPLCDSVLLIQPTLIDSEPMKQLRHLQDKAIFPRDITSSDNARNKCNIPSPINY